MKIQIPENWNEVKLSDYLEYYKRIKPYLNSEDEDMLNNAAIDAALTQICKVDYETLKTLDATDAIMVKTEVAKLLAQSTNVPLVRFFTIEVDGETIEYGFEPTLDEMSYGCYLDLADAGKDLWANIWMFLSTLYRPVVYKAGKRYRIAEYEGTDFSLIPHLKKVITADIALGAVFFFIHLQRELLTNTLTYTRKLMNRKKGLVSRALGNHSQVNTEDLVHSLASLEETLLKSTQLPDYQSTFVSLHSSITRNEAKLNKLKSTE